MVKANGIGGLKSIVFLKLPIGMAAFLSALLTAAGTIDYWQAWAVSGALLGAGFIVGIHFLKADPDFLIHRLQFREKEKIQRKIVVLTDVFFLAVFVLPGIDHRFGWSHVPAWLSLFSLALFLTGYAFIILVFKINRYASRIVEVQQGQKVITTGPYAIVRHPMYAAQILLFPSFLLSLGSWWACLLSVSIVIPLVFRIRNEENVLSSELPGYREYCEKTRYRLLPHIW